MLRAIDMSLGEPWSQLLAQHLGHGIEGEECELRRGRRYAVARRLGGLSAVYAVQRPGMLTNWREGVAGTASAGALTLIWLGSLFCGGASWNS